MQDIVINPTALFITIIHKMPVIKYLQLFVFGMIVITLVQHYTKESDSDLWYLENEYNISSVRL